MHSLLYTIPSSQCAYDTKPQIGLHGALDQGFPYNVCVYDKQVYHPDKTIDHTAHSGPGIDSSGAICPIPLVNFCLLWPLIGLAFIVWHES